jgi:hypothetical protein
MLPGFERVSLQSHLRRFFREADKTAPNYGVTFSYGERHFEDGLCPTVSFDMATQGAGWRVNSEIVIYGLDRLNKLYDDRPWPLRLLIGFRSICELFLLGAAFGYLRDGWRLFPFSLVAAAFALMVIAVMPPLRGETLHLLWSVPVAIFGACVLCVLGKRMHVPLMMDLWALTVDVARNRRPKVDEFLAHVAEDLVKRITTSTAEEIIVVGHSFGAVPAVIALADPRVMITAQTQPTGLLAAGSYLLAVAHHPSAKALREATRRVLRGPIAWLEAQSHTDPINFFRTNPADALSVHVGKRPSIVEVRFKQQLTPESYQLIRGDFFRTHRQFVFGVEKRSHYALFAIIGGPERFADVAARGGLEEDWLHFGVVSLKGKGLSRSA